MKFYIVVNENGQPLGVKGTPSRMPKVYSSKAHATASIKYKADHLRSAAIMLRTAQMRKERGLISGNGSVYRQLYEAAIKEVEPLAAFKARLNVTEVGEYEPPSDDTSRNRKELS